MKRNIVFIIAILCAMSALKCNAQHHEKSDSFVALYGEGTGIHINKDSAQIIAVTNAVIQLVNQVKIKESIGEYPMERMETRYYDSGKTIEHKGVGRLFSNAMMVGDFFELIDGIYRYDIKIIIDANKVKYPSANELYNKTDNADSPSK